MKIKKYAEDLYADEEYVESRKKSLSRYKLKVFYGIGKVGGLRKKRSIEIFYANSPVTERMEHTLKAAISAIAYTRYQSDSERESAYYANRVWTAYTYFIDEKPYKGSLNAVLSLIEKTDALDVPEKQKKEAVNALRKAWMTQNPGYKEPGSYQLELELF